VPPAETFTGESKVASLQPLDEMVLVVATANRVRPCQIPTAYPVTPAGARKPTPVMRPFRDGEYVTRCPCPEPDQPASCEPERAQAALSCGAADSDEGGRAQTPRASAGTATAVVRRACRRRSRTTVRRRWQARSSLRVGGRSGDAERRPVAGVLGTTEVLSRRLRGELSGSGGRRRPAVKPLPAADGFTPPGGQEHLAGRSWVPRTCPRPARGRHRTHRRWHHPGPWTGLGVRAGGEGASCSRGRVCRP
jgi:hypothetical protein